MKPHTFPTHSHYGQREFFGRKWREYGRNRGADAKLGKPLEESQVVFFLRAFPRGEIILEVLEMPGTPEKQKGAAATITKQIQKLAKNNQWQPNILLFPLIPTKARTTKLAQKLENTQNQLKPCSASGLLRGNLFKDTILTLLDPIWVCWKLFKFVPQLCKKGNRSRPFARSCLRSLAFG